MGLIHFMVGDEAAPPTLLKPSQLGSCQADTTHLCFTSLTRESGQLAAQLGCWPEDQIR
jgi:hypothetical protein